MTINSECDILGASKDYTRDRRGELIAIIKQPREHLGKDFFRMVAGYMWNECHTDKDRDMGADIYKDGSFVAGMGTAYLASYERVHTTICGKAPSNPCTFRAFNHPERSDEITIPSYNPTNK